MKLTRLCPLLLTALLQVMPLARVVLTDQLPAAPGASILFKWAVGAFALMGFHAVAGATNVMLSSSTAQGTNGVFFRYRILMSEPFSASFSANPLPPGLAINDTLGSIQGTPNFSGNMDVTLTVSDPFGKYPPYFTTVSLTILPPLPAFTQQPAGRTNFAGGSVSFSATASAGSSYVWFFSPPGSANVTFLLSETNVTLALTNLNATNAGAYRLLAYNGTGESNSAPATLTVVPRPALTSLGVSGANTLMSLPVVPNLAYAIESAANAAGLWTLLTNLPPVSAATNFTIPAALTPDTARFYRMRAP